MNPTVTNIELQEQFLDQLKNYVSSDELKLIKNTLFNSTRDLKDEYSFSSELKRYIDITITILQTSLNTAKYLELIFKLARFSISHGQHSISEELFTKVIQANRRFNRFDEVAAKSYMGLAEISVVQAKWNETNNYLNKARSLFGRKNNKTGLAEIENFLGTVYGEKGKINLAQKHFENAHLLLKSTRNNLLKSKVENNLGILLTMQKNTEDAKQYFESALSTFIEHKQYKYIAEVTHNLGMLYSKEGRFDKAIKNFEITLNIAVKAGLQPIIGIAYLGAAEAYLNTGDINKSDLYATLGLASCLLINDRLTSADIYKIKGMIEWVKKNYQGAEIYFLTSLRINEELGNEMNYAETSVQLCKFYKDQKNSPKCKTYYETALKYYSKYNCTKEIEELTKIYNN